MRNQQGVKSAPAQQSCKLFLSGNVVHQAFFSVENELCMSILTESLASRTDRLWPARHFIQQFEKLWTKKSPGGSIPGHPMRITRSE
jgi:hypothetical protein